jgi:hypothetical protein
MPLSLAMKDSSGSNLAFSQSPYASAVKETTTLKSRQPPQTMRCENTLLVSLSCVSIRRQGCGTTRMLRTEFLFCACCVVVYACHCRLSQSGQTLLALIRKAECGHMTHIASAYTFKKTCKPKVDLCYVTVKDMHVMPCRWWS